MAEATPVTINLDGREVVAQPGEMLIAAAERAGTYIPRFCYHPRMEPVGVCRMCLVEVETPRGPALQPSCYIAATDGMVVRTDSEMVKKAQDGVLEFLLANHPLDCPVCDKGGECPLQDQTVAYGPGESRFVEEKRHFEKPVPISDLVLLDRERCIQCSRCTRFAAEVAGEAQIDFAGRGEQIHIAPFPEDPFSSYFSGNTVQICPVGALTAKPYRFTARPWDLDQVESTCTTCSVGCRVAVQSSGNRVTRVLGVDSDAVNHGWLCDKGRFAFEATNGDDAELARITEPMRRMDGRLVSTSWDEALGLVAKAVREAQASGFADAVALIGGASGTNESAYAWAKLVKGLLGSDSADAQLGDGLDAELIAALPRASVNDAANAKVVLSLGGDLREELPVLFLRLREAITRGGTKLVELAPRGTALTSLATAAVQLRPGDELTATKAVLGDEAAATALATHPEGPTFGPDVLAAGREALAGDGEGVVIVLGRGNLASAAAFTEAAAALLAAKLPKARFLSGLRRGNVHGAIDLGLAPGLLPGRVGLSDGRARFEAAWGAAPSARGRSSLELLTALAKREPTAPKVLFLLGSDPMADLPDAALAAEALANAPVVVALSSHGSRSAELAHVVLPLTATHEESGTATNLEGRVAKVSQKVVAPGLAWPAWMVAAELADALGLDLGFTSREEITEEIAAVAPAYAGIGLAALDAAADGVLAPLGSEAAGGTAEPIDPVAFPGLQALERVGLAAREGAVQPEARPEHLDLPAATPLSLPSVDEPVTPAADAYALRLVSTRRLYDQGSAVAGSPSMAALAPAAGVLLNPYDLNRLGVESGAQLRVRSAKGNLVLVATADEGVLRGTAELPFNLAGAEQSNAAAALMDSIALVTDLRLESL